MNIKQAKEQIQHAVAAYLTRDEYGEPVIPVERQRPIFLMGAPGIGKTDIMAQIARELGIALVAYSMTHHTRQSALGLPFIVEKEYGGAKYSVSEYTMSEIIASIYDCMEATRLDRGILFLDEINCVSETLAPSMLQFLQYKTFGRHRVPEGWIIVTAGNPPEYNNSVREFDIVTWDRMKRIDVEPDYGVWKEYAMRTGVHPAVTSYLEIRPQDFYLIESTAEGKRFVTARGWVDLSDMIKLYEKHGFPVDEALVRQYLQNDRIAKSFAMYCDLFEKYRSDYQVDRILAGEADGAIVERAKSAKFDERLSLLSLLLDGVGGDIARVSEKTQARVEAAERLRSMRGRIEHADAANAREAIAEAVRAIQRRAEQGKRSGTMGADALRAAHGAAEVLQSMAASLSDDEAPFDQLKALFRQGGDALNLEAGEARARLDNMFAFCEAAFPESQELLILVTELTANPAAAGFIARYGCDAYFRHSQDLMFHERGSDLKRASRGLDLD